MSTLRITREFRFEMAHALLGYDGLCSNIHGHSYQLTVTIIGTPVNDSLSPKNGMVIDFGELKDIITKEIISKFDHAMVLNDAAPDKKQLMSMSLFSKVVFLPYQPTCENMLADFAARISKQLPAQVKLHNLRLRETHNAYAEWFAEDNQ